MYNVYMYMYNTNIVVLVLQCLMLSKNAFAYSRYCIALKYPDYKECSDFRMSIYTCTCLQFDVLHSSCAEGLHFSALVNY